MRKIELGGSMEALVSTGPFENQRVFFHFKECLEGEFSDAELVTKQRTLYKTHVSDLVEEQEKELTIKAVQKEFKHLRIMQCPICGKKKPSVTTVRDFDSKGFFCTDQELDVAIALGCIQDLRGRHFVSTGDWKDAKDIETCWPHLVTLKKYSVDPSQANAFNFPAFLKKYPIKDMKVGERLWDCENEITFEPDFFGTPEGDWAENVPTVFDWKRNVDKLSAMTQMSVCAKKLGLTQMVAIPVNGETAQGFSKPVVSKDVNGYFEIFMDKRRAFRKRYGL